MHSSGTLSRREGATWLAVLPLLLYLLLAGAGAWAGVYVTGFRAASLAILILVFAGWAVAAWYHPVARPRSMLWPVLVLIVAAQTVAAVLSPLPRIGLEYAGYTAILAGLYLLLVRLVARPALARRIALVLAIVTLVIAAVYLAIAFSIWLEWWRLLGRLTVPPLRPDYVAIMYGAPGILTAFLVGGALASTAMLWPAGPRERALCGLLWVVVLAAVVVASARSAWVALPVAIAVGAVLVFLTGGRSRLPASRGAKAAIGAGAGVAVVLLVAIGPALAQRLTAGGGEDLRVSLVANAMRAFAHDAVTGGGPGTWVIARISNTERDEIDWYIPHAHNVPAQTLAESGVLGVVVGIVAILAVGSVVVRAFRSGDGVRRTLAIGVVVIGAYLAIHQLFDFFLDMPAILFAAVLPLATLDALDLASRGAAGNAPPRRWLVAVPAAIAIVPLLLLLTVERPALVGDEAALEMPDDAPMAAVLAAEANDADGTPTSYRWTRGLAMATLGQDTSALDDLLSVARQDDLPQAWLNAAQLQLTHGDTDGARDSIARALRIGRQQPGIDVAAIPILLALGDTANAQEQATSALSGAPQLTDDPWWETTPELRALRDVAVNVLVNASDSSRAWQIALLSGDADRARQIAATLPTDRAIVGDVIDAWSNVPGARERLERGVLADPLGPGAGWAARIAARDGDADAAHRFRRIASIPSGSTRSDNGYDVVVTDQIPVGQVPGPNAGFHFAYAYHRGSPLSMLVPGLPQIDLR